MKVIFEFDPYDDKEDLAVFQNAKATYSAIIYLRDYARTLNKYDDRDLLPKDEVIATINEILEEINEI